jgi:hypothetical protein
MQVTSRGNHRQLETIRSADLVKHAREMVLHRLLTHRALKSNLFIGAPGDDQVQDLTLARGEADRDRRTVECVRRLQQRADNLDQMRHVRLAEPAATSHDAPYRLEQRFGGRILQKYASDSKMDRGDQFDPVNHAGKQNNAQHLVERRKLPQRVQAGHSRHRQIEKDKIRANALDDAHCFLAASGFADDIEYGSDVDSIDLAYHGRRHPEQLPEARSKQALIVGENDANRIRTGRVAVTA